VEKEPVPDLNWTLVAAFSPMLKKLSKIVRCELPESVPEKSLNQTKIVSKICTVF